jgi:uncharacterized membrane protein
MALARLGNRIAPPRYVLFVIVAVAGWFAWRHWVPGSNWKDAVAMAFDMGALVFIGSLIPLLRDSDPDTIRRHARENDANRGIILLLTSLLTVVVMIAIAGELKGAKSGETLSMVKLVATLVLIWLFANTVYALHYAHLFYSEADGKDAGGLEIPECETPRYGDFAYFAFTLGMTFQTSDVQITGRSIRAVALLHSAAAFIFNIGVIAFTINTIGGS